MQRIKNISLILFCFLLFWGCASNSSVHKLNYSSYIIELNQYGKELKKWYPIEGSVYVNIYNDELTFIDKNTKKKHTISSSYKLIGK